MNQVCDRAVVENSPTAEPVHAVHVGRRSTHTRRCVAVGGDQGAGRPAKCSRTAWVFVVAREAMSRRWSLVEAPTPRSSRNERLDRLGNGRRPIVMEHVAGSGDGTLLEPRDRRQPLPEVRGPGRPVPLGVGIGRDPEDRRGDLAPAGEHLVEPIEYRMGAPMAWVGRRLVAIAIAARPERREKHGLPAFEPRVDAGQVVGDRIEVAIAAKAGRSVQVVEPAAVALDCLAQAASDSDRTLRD